MLRIKFGPPNYAFIGPKPAYQFATNDKVSFRLGDCPHEIYGTVLGLGLAINNVQLWIIEPDEMIEDTDTGLFYRALLLNGDQLQFIR